MKSMQEVYRDPYQDRIFEQTEPLQLTEEQSVAIETNLTNHRRKKT